jgi:flagellin-like protein
MVEKEGVFSMFKGSKRAMSPLIATVLLIAFAVALGAMIMNWSSTLGGGPDCSGISMIINPYICYANKMIRLSVENTGSEVESVNVHVIDDNANEASFKYNTKIVASEVFQKDFPFEMTANTKVELIPNIKVKNEVVSCDKPVLTVDELKNCAN